MSAPDMTEVIRLPLLKETIEKRLAELAARFA